MKQAASNVRILLGFLILLAPMQPTSSGGGSLGSSGGGSGSSTSLQATISTSGIATATMQGLSCLNLRPTGACLWLVCAGYVCTIEVTIQYGHFNPDVVVSSYNGTASKSGNGGSYVGNPWDEARKLYSATSNASAHSILSALGPVATLFGGAERTEGGPGRPDHTFPTHQNMLFKEVDGLGHPAADFLYKISSSTFCQSDASILEPYYLSALDSIGWRYAMPDMIDDLDSWIPGRREIGSWPTNTWGAVMPRSGFGTQSDQPKIGAVTAQRAADLFTNSNTGHVAYGLGNGRSEQKYSDDGDQIVWTPPPIKENDNTGGIWQMIVPKIDTDCQIFGQNDTVSLSGWGGGKVSSSGDYAFTLWRPYKCCEVVEGGIFIAAVGSDYPTADIGKPKQTGSASSGSIFGGGSTSGGTSTTSGGTVQ